MEVLTRGAPKLATSLATQLAMAGERIASFLTPLKHCFIFYFFCSPLSTLDDVLADPNLLPALPNK